MRWQGEDNQYVLLGKLPYDRMIQGNANRVVLGIGKFQR
jgi:hypothetical protein